MNQSTLSEIAKRINRGIVGLASLLVGLYIGYELILWISKAPTQLFSVQDIVLMWNYDKWLAGGIIIMLLLRLSLVIIWIGLIIIFLLFAHPFLKSAIRGTPLDTDLVTSRGTWIVWVIISIAVMWVLGQVLPLYMASDPHIGQTYLKR